MGSLEEQRQAFTQRRFLAMPMAGMIVWTIIGFAGTIFSDLITVWVLFIGTGSIVYLGMFISKFTGENFMDSSKPKNTFDTLFLLSTGMAVLVYSIAIPFFMVDHTSLALKCRNSDRVNVDAFFLDHSTLGWYFSQRISNFGYCYCLVFISSCPVYLDPICHCGDLCNQFRYFRGAI